MLYREAISKAMVDAMERDPKVVLLGQNVTAPHAVFGTTAEAYRRWPERCIEAPISETMLTGACVGMAMEGYKPIFVHTRADFSLFSFEHLINTAAKLPFLHGRPMPFVMRCIIGRGWGQGPVHSQSFHRLLREIPGLEVIIPASGDTYRRWMTYALEARNPVVLIEPRRLFEREDYPKEVVYQRSAFDLIPIGDTIIEALEAQRRLKEAGIVTCIEPWEYIGEERPHDNGVVIDMAPRRWESGLIAPPFEPQGVSRVYQEAWYPTADEIVEEVCRILGREAPPREERHESILAGSPF